MTAKTVIQVPLCMSWKSSIEGENNRGIVDIMEVNKE
jgi:hypothetical protein